MSQNSIRSRLRRAAWQITPAPILHLVFGERLRGMGRLIDAAAIKGARRIDVPGVSIACCQLDLADGTVIVSTPPSHNNVKITHAARRKLGLGPEYAKALVDLVVRYSYPHAMVPVLRIPVVDRERGGFHLQHRNLPQETSDFIASTRAFLETHFTPQPGWNILDIGCYLGHGTTRLAQIVGPQGRVIAVEAIPENATIAAFQIGQNGLPQAEVINRAIWREAGATVAMHRTENQANAIAGDVVASSQTIDLPTTSIAELTGMLGRAADLVSLTVNGAEVEAIDSLDTMPPDLRPWRMVMPGWYPNDAGPRSKPIVAKLQALGYQTLVTSHNFVIAWRIGI